MFFTTALVALAAAGSVLSAPVVGIAQRHEGTGPEPEERALYRSTKAAASPAPTATAPPAPPAGAVPPVADPNKALPPLIYASPVDPSVANPAANTSAIPIPTNLPTKPFADGLRLLVPGLVPGSGPIASISAPPFFKAAPFPAASTPALDPPPVGAPASGPVGTSDPFDSTLEELD